MAGLCILGSIVRGSLADGGAALRDESAPSDEPPHARTTPVSHRCIVAGCRYRSERALRKHRDAAHIKGFTQVGM